MSVIDGSLRSNTAIVTGVNTRVLAIAGDTFRRFVEERAHVSGKIIGVLANRLRQLTDRADHTCPSSALRRRTPSPPLTSAGLTSRGRAPTSSGSRAQLWTCSAKGAVVGRLSLSRRASGQRPAAASVVDRCRRTPCMVGPSLSAARKLASAPLRSSRRCDSPARRGFGLAPSEGQRAGRRSAPHAPQPDLGMTSSFAQRTGEA